MAVGEIVVFKIRKDGSEELARIEAQDRGYWTDKHGKKVRAWALNNWTPGQPGFYLESDLPIDEREQK
tara:strand:+ start:693 stop:896 length:204 start_codon:yes stop_codon:yes gene_type:complete